MKRKNYCYITWYHPNLKNRQDLLNLKNLFVLFQNNHQSLVNFKCKKFLTLIEDKSVAMNTLMNYLKEQYFWAIIFHPNVKVDLSKVEFPKVSRVFYSNGLDWQNFSREFNALHFAFVTRTQGFLPWNSFKFQSDSQDSLITSIKYSKMAKRIDPFWKLIN